MTLRRAFALLALFLCGCYYNPVPLSVKGNLVCTYNGSRAFAGDITISGDGITDGLHTFNPNGSWKLCASDQPIECTVTTHAAPPTMPTAPTMPVLERLDGGL